MRTVKPCLQILWLLCATVVQRTSGEDAPAAKTAEKLEPAATTAAAKAPVAAAAAVTAADDVSILKQINKVNDDGSYTFGYEASDGSFKVETRDVAGNVKGMFGFVDETGNLKRVSYSASNSSGFQTAAGPSNGDSANPVAAKPSPLPPSSAVQAIPRKDADEAKSVKKILVSKRPVPEPDRTGGRREGNDLRRQLPRNDDAPDVYGVHGRPSLQSTPVSPVVSALMSELDPVRVSYRPQPPVRATYDRPGPPFRRVETVGSDRQTTTQEDDDDDEPSPPAYRPVPVQYRQQYAQPYPVVQYQRQQQQQQQYYPAVAQPYGTNAQLAALRDELMELILAFVQARVSQLPLYPQTAVAAAAAIPYPMPYQQPNYYVPSYYQGPRVQLGPGPEARQQDVYDARATQQTPRITQTLKDGLIRMLLSTSPRYDPDVIAQSTPRLAYRRTTQSTPVRNVQIIDDGSDSGADSRPVTTETPD